MNTTNQRTTVTVDGDRLVIRTPFSPESAEFCRSLPESRGVYEGKGLAKQFKHWTCLLTPWTAWRIVAQFKNCDTAGDSTLNVLADQCTTARWAHKNSKLWPDDCKQPAMQNLKSWDHQRVSYSILGGAYCSLQAQDMGTGKTKPIVDLVQNSAYKMTLVFCPLKAIAVWLREFRQHAVIDITTLGLGEGSGTLRAKRAAAAIELHKRENTPLVVIINYESSSRPAMAKVLLSTNWDLMVCDESHRIGNDHRASRFAYKVGKKAKQRVCLSGTPMEETPLNLYGQFRFLDPGIVGTSVVRFRNRYARFSEMFPAKVIEYINQEELREKYHAISYRVEADDVLDLPPIVHNQRTVRLSTKTRALYDTMRRDSIIEVADGTITASNALVRMLRLQQLTSGFVKDEDGVETEVGTEKAEVLRELMEDINEPIVVFCRFTRDLAVVRSITESLGRRYGEISGASKTGIDEDACMKEGIDVVGVQMRSGGESISLTRARYGIYYSVEWSLGKYLQTIKRIHRPPQTKHTFIYHILCENTVDERVYEAFRNKKSVIDAVLADFTTEV